MTGNDPTVSLTTEPHRQLNADIFVRIARSWTSGCGRGTLAAARRCFFSSGMYQNCDVVEATFLIAFKVSLRPFIAAAQWSHRKR